MGEIDRVLKKVQEGVDVFDSIWNKVYDTENANQKEKFEADLKKEIKKLQRYRDQIKTWIQSTEIKDKKVSASYEQALMDARKQIEREMERFKICEKETKTKAFSKEGLGQQPKTDPKEKAKSETRDWLNNVVGDLESQIDNFEAEVEGLSVKKGKTRPARLVHLEISITRHKAHIQKLELILRLLDNDELSTDQVNDVRDFLEDYVERNQENFEEFNDVDELYSTLSLDDLEDLGTLGPSLVKTALPSPTQLSTVLEQNEETDTQDNPSEVSPRTPPSKSGATGLAMSAPSPIVGSVTPAVSNSPATANIPVRPLVRPTSAAILPVPVTVRGVTDNSATTAVSSLVSSSSVKDDDSINLPSHRASPVIPEIGLERGINRGISNQTIISSPTSLSSVSGTSTNGALGSVPAVSDIANRNVVNVDESIGTGLSQPLGSLSNRILMQQVTKSNERTGSPESNNVGEGAVGGRVFSPSVTGVQWRPQSLSSYQNQSETGQIRGRPEIAPDQKDNYIQRYEQLSLGKQQGHNALNVPHLSGTNHKQFSTPQQSPLLQQFNSQSSLVSPQVGLGLSVQAPGLATSASATQQQQAPTHQQTPQRSLISTGPKDTDVVNPKIEEQRQNFSEDLNGEPTTTSASKIINDDDLKTSYTVTSSAPVTDSNQLPRDTDLSPGQPFQPNQPSSSLGVIGRRSVSDLGAIGDNLSGQAGNSGGMHDQLYNLQMLEAAYHKLPQPQDSERVKNYIPRHPAVTPASYPQTQAPIVDNPALWEKLSLDSAGLDTFFFAFYYQQNTYQQYLAAKELKKQSWRFHKKFNTWFQRHQEPKVTTDDFEMGTYVYFDFNFADDQQGWCQRIKTEFTFQYDFLEDELVS